MGIVIYRDSAQDDRAWCVGQGLLRCSFGAQSKQHGQDFILPLQFDLWAYPMNSLRLQRRSILIGRFFSMGFIDEKLQIRLYM